jgi:CotH protein
MQRALGWAAALLALACGDEYPEGELEAFTGSDLPVVVVDTGGRRIPDEPKLPAELRLFEAPVTGLEALAGPPALQSAIGIEVRGYTSQEFPKKQYSLEARSATGGDADIGPLGLPAEEDWVLHAPFMDKSLLRNALGYELSRRLGRYAPRTRFVELFLLDDGAAAPRLEHYRGVYVLTESVKRGAERVDIEKLEPTMVEEPLVSGGYLLEWTERSRVERGEPFFGTRDAEALLLSHPRAEDVRPPQLAWIERYVEAFEAALARLASDPESRELEAFLDLDAAVDYCLLSELVRNHDVFVASTFIHKRRSGPLVLGPLWDLDRAFGDVEFGGNWRAEGWLVPSRGWARELFQSSSFRQRYVERWHAHRTTALASPAMAGLISSLERELAGAAARNFEKWPILGRYVKANRAPYSESFAEEIAKLSAWLDERAAWIDAHIDEYLPAQTAAP